jgi:hypothetical protein
MARQSSTKRSNSKSVSSQGKANAKSKTKRPLKSRGKSSTNTSAQTKPAGTSRKKGVAYRGEEFEGYNKPKLTPEHSSKKAAVLAKEGDTIKLIRFGQQGYGHNYSEEARKSYLARSKKQKGADSKLSAVYWARKFLWAGKGGATQQPE